MNINFKASNMEMTDPIHDYVIKRVTNLGKLLSKIEESGGEALVYFEVAKTTNHHKTGQIFRADCKIRIDGKEFYSSSEKDDLYAAVDECKDRLFREIKRDKNKRFALFKRGATKIKDLFKGLISFKKFRK